MKNLTMLMILDGFGVQERTEGNAIKAAKTPNLDQLFHKYPNTTLGASGLEVGLPPGQMGNSEVGHLNIGSGRIVYQELTKISKEIEDCDFFKNETLNQAISHCKQNKSSLHLLGLLSDGGVHSHISHLFALLQLAKDQGLKNVYVHAALDGRDVPPRCAMTYIQELEDEMKRLGIGKIASIAGRYYMMDRDNRWERVKEAYGAMALGSGQFAKTACEALENAYARGENDEFVLPTMILGDDASIYPITIQDNDAMIMFNFRPDRAREITRVFVDPKFEGFSERKQFKNLYYVCFTQYDATMPNVHVAFLPQSLNNTLGEYLSKKKKTQLRIAETEKYAHVTFFFNGGIEKPYKGEKRRLVSSPKVATYDLQPQMSAPEVTEKAIEAINSNKFDVIVLNFANPDMVGHTGSMPAAIKAVEAVDICVGKIAKILEEKNAQLILTADHGNADYMLDEKGNVVTSHSLNPVPFLLISHKKHHLRKGGVLADIAPTLLEIMDLPIPKEMTGKSLLLEK